MPSNTERRVAIAAGKPLHASVAHTSYKAFQFDFYIPKSIWKVPIVEDFLDSLAALGGATVFDDEIGIWKGGTEKTQVFRLVVRAADLPINRLRKTLKHKVGALMASLSATKYAQETLLYTETVVRMAMARHATRIA
jgi:hypothetical protein